LSNSVPDNVRRKKQIIGVIAVALIIVLFIFYFIGFVDLLIFIIVAVAISLVANLILRRIGSQPL
jgi:hypothetical protein